MAHESWKTAYRSFYYEHAPIPSELMLDPAKTALLVIDVQNAYLAESSDPQERARWSPFMDRMHGLVIPNIQRLIKSFRDRSMNVMFARIACQTKDGRDRSLSQRKPGFNNLLLPKDEHASQIIDALAPKPDEIVVTKTTDSALTGTNLRLMLHNIGIHHVICVGIFTDQCVSSTVRSLADESFDVVVCHDACAAATDALHENELKTINWIYCQVASTQETLEFIR
ncbi:cysteine hydrolase family protein [Zwartia vadi]|uniref:cysteine hydrolase family protein n=1 Tax=Zwartia vadi TaxID=3058168 RepID=UPI0025B4CEAF|nr:isochorismatase family cysteine hydrolase [Zwartia vadi]MDN3986590.1 isochorismatase family cysteine hydrolase [Zwartia vadi]